MSKETRQIEIAFDLYEKLQEKDAKTKFKSVDAYTEHLLSQVLQTSIKT